MLFKRSLKQGTHLAMNIISKFQAKLWENALPSSKRSGVKILKKPLLGAKMAQWYPIQPKMSLMRRLNHSMGLPYFDLYEEERLAKLKMKALKGKSAPAKKKPGDKPTKKSKKK